MRDESATIDESLDFKDGVALRSGQDRTEVDIGASDERRGGLDYNINNKGACGLRPQDWRRKWGGGRGSGSGGGSIKTKRSGVFIRGGRSVGGRWILQSVCLDRVRVQTTELPACKCVCRCGYNKRVQPAFRLRRQSRAGRSNVLLVVVCR